MNLNEIETQIGDITYAIHLLEGDFGMESHSIIEGLEAARGSIEAKELAAAIGRSKETADQRLAKLRDLGLVEWTGRVWQEVQR